MDIKFQLPLFHGVSWSLFFQSINELMVCDALQWKKHRSSRCGGWLWFKAGKLSFAIENITLEYGSWNILPSPEAKAATTTTMNIHFAQHTHHLPQKRRVQGVVYDSRDTPDVYWSSAVRLPPRAELLPTSPRHI